MIAKILIGCLGAVLVYFGIAGILIATDAPKAAGSDRPDGGLDFSDILGADLSQAPQPLSYEARDGSVLSYRLYPSSGASGRVLVLVHGSGWHGLQFHAMAQSLADDGVADIVVPDLRGHGEAPQRRGDVDYIGQLEDDLADLIALIRADKPEAEIVLGGHSSGGGLVVRFAGGAHGALADRFILMAPFLKHDAPTTRPNSGGWAQPAVRRIIGLTLLNNFGITMFNQLPVIGFAMPRTVLEGPLGHTATTAYSFRLNTSFAPRADFGADLAKMRQPFLLIAGENDEAFVASAYEGLISARTGSGQYALIPGAGHLGLVVDPAAIARIKAFLIGFRP